jgi:CSLREA domain-containing protein
MSRLRLGLSASATIALLLMLGSPIATAATTGSAPGVTVSVPRHATRNLLTAVTVSLPRNVAAVEGRLLVAKNVAVLMGVAPAKGIAMRPASVKGGYSFVAYNLSPVGGRNALQLVVLPHKAGILQLRVTIDSMADKQGIRLAAPSAANSGTVPVKAGTRKHSPSTFHAAPAASSVPLLAPRFPAQPARKLFGPGTTINRMDLDQVRYGWTTEHAQNASCSGAPAGDINADGCVDAVDFQATVAALRADGNARAITTGHTPTVRRRNTITPIPGRTFTVTSTADTTDAQPEDGVCADSQGRCTLRAAIMEADWDIGDDTIAFNIPGGGVPLIQLSGGLPLITSRSGTLTIDGYTQPGAKVNSAQTLTNGHPGVEVRGNGKAANEFGFYITSGGNTIRGLAISYLNVGIMLDGANATQNRIIGNWIGFSGAGANYGGTYGVLVNTGANNNLIGTPDLADRNLIGSWATGVNHYGPGTDYNVTQNNVFCINPAGGTAECGTGVDHNFGPKNGLIGGTGTNDLNVFGPSSLQAVEYSHGWNPSLPPRTDNNVTWQINNNRLIGNWLGFRADGSPDPNYSSGKTGTGDNGEVVNVFDGSNYTLVKGNYMASLQAGVQVMAPNAKYNEVRNNLIGIAPNGQAAVLGQYGVRLLWQAQWEIVQGNTIRNAGWGGIGMTMNTVYNTRLSQNIVTNSTGPAIFATWDAASQTGSDMWISPPVITSATTTQVSGTGIAAAEVEVYHATRSANGSNSGLPDVYLGTATASSNGTWSLPVSGLNTGDSVVALQIRSDQNTSVLGINVQVGGSPPPDQRIAADSFSRTVSNGWGTAEVGGAWATSDTPSSYSVQNGVGTITTAHGQARDALLIVGTKDVTISGSVRFSLTPSGGNAFAYIEARRTGTDGYRGTIRVASNGGVFAQLRKTVNGVETAVAGEVSTGLNIGSSGALGYRFTVQGSHLQLRVWDASAAEPSAWQTQADDTSISGAGAVGVRAYLGGPVTNGPITLSFDDFLAQKP